MSDRNHIESSIVAGVSLSDADVRWYAVWTRSRHEQVVRQQLEKKGFESFLPTIPRWSRWKDRKKKIDWPLFPGYCFARFVPGSTLAILKCTGVVSIVSLERAIREKFPAEIAKRNVAAANEAHQLAQTATESAHA